MRDFQVVALVLAGLALAVTTTGTLEATVFLLLAALAVALVGGELDLEDAESGRTDARRRNR